MKALIWLWNNPWAIVALLAASVFGIINYQGWRIDGLKDDKVKAEEAFRAEKKINGKVVEAFNDKEVKTNDTNKFTRRAAESIARKGTGASAAPGLADAYERVYARLNARNSDNTD